MPVIHIEMLEGRTAEQKCELAEVMTREMARIAKCSLDSVQVVISEVHRDNWAIGGVLASTPKQAGSPGR